MSAAVIIISIQVVSGCVVFILVFLQIMKFKRTFPILRFITYGAFALALGGIALGKYYAATAPKRLGPIEASKPATAVSGYTEAIRLDPGAAELYFSRGRTNFHLQRYADAVIDFTKALELSPDNPRYLAHRAFAFRFLGDIQSAEHDISRSIERGYRDPEALMIEALISRKRGRYEDATQQYTAALSAGTLHPENRCFSLVERSIAYEETGEYAKALNDLNQVNCESEREAVFLNRGNLYSLMKQDDLALLDWEMALKLDPNDPAVLKNRGVYFLDHGQLERALADFNRYIAIRRDDPYGYTIRSEIYAKMGETARAQADLKSANELYTTNRARLYPSIPGGLMTQFGRVPTT